MTTANPYSPPRADVADFQDGDAGFSEPRIWSASGRIGRLRYLAYTVGGYLVFIAVSMLIGALAGAMKSSALITAIAGIGGLIYFVLAILAGIQRAHDMDWSGWMVLIALIPLVGLIWVFKSGTEGANRYGAPPPPNTTSIKLLALLLPIIAVVGLVAAVALPAYQQYVTRAHAAQVH